jgi:aminomethyltransferase
MQHTPLYSEYERAGARVVDFHGWALPVQFAGIMEEHAHVRTKAGLFDCSHMGEFLLSGKDAIRHFDSLVYADMVGLKPGKCRYGALLNVQAGIIDDCVGLKLSDDQLYVVNNAGPLEAVAAMIGADGPNVTNLSSSTAKLDLQGPLSRGILLDLGMDAVKDLKFWTCTTLVYESNEIIVARAGYTGELGYELYVPNALGPLLWQRLLSHPDVMPCGLGARDTLRMEMGYPLYGQDVDQQTTPLEADMGRFIRWEKDFQGKTVLEGQRDSGTYQVLTGIRSTDRRAPRPGFKIYHEETEVGEVTSGTFGPSVGHGIGLVRVPKALSTPGIQLTAGPRKMAVETTQVPFYREGTCRNKIG